MGLIDRYIKKILLKVKNFNEIDSNTIIEESTVIKGSKIDKNIRINKNSKILYSSLSGNINIGNNTLLNSIQASGNISIGNYCRVRSCFLLGNISIGNYTSLWGPNLDFRSSKENIKIGNFCSIARNVSFQSFNHNHKKVTTYFIGQNLFNEKWENEKISKGDITILNDVWIGTQSVILGGVIIGNGAVVAANSVVTNNVPPYSIVAGSPAKVIGYRFEQPQIDKLLLSNWWNWSHEELIKNKEFFKKDIIDV